MYTNFFSRGQLDAGLTAIARATRLVSTNGALLRVMMAAPAAMLRTVTRKIIHHIVSQVQFEYYIIYILIKRIHINNI